MGHGPAVARSPADEPRAQAEEPLSDSDTADSPSPSAADENANTTDTAAAPTTDDGVLALASSGDHTLTVTLVSGDPEFPKLVADPIFSPVYGSGDEFGANPEAMITNGAFRLASVEKQGVTLERSNNYWNRDAVKLDIVRFVPTESVDDALEAYRSGVVDAVTNAEYGPLVLKLLAPYDDFRRATHGAVNLYEVNVSRYPFSDRRVREALAIAIEREKLTEGEMEGATRPAARFIPFGGKQVAGIVQDAEKARNLLDAAGYPAGEGFPAIKLVVNRNDTQLRIARAVSRMWKQNLNIDTELVIREQSEMDAVRRAGDFDLIRRGIVFPTANVMSNMAAILQPGRIDPGTFGNGQIAPFISPTASPGTAPVAAPGPTTQSADNDIQISSAPAPPIPTEDEALYELRAIPLYFPTSYSLVKPYVQGFEPNGLDVYSLRDVMINNGWQPNRAGSESN
jgi:oligopeptide transport system substrate-binding protein